MANMKVGVHAGPLIVTDRNGTAPDIYKKLARLGTFNI